MTHLFFSFCLLVGLGLSACSEQPAPAESAVEGSIEAESADVEVGDEITVMGRLINTLCYSAENPADHDTSLECAANNTAQGLPVAVLETDRSIKEAWILVTVPQIFTDYMHQNVRVQGEIRSAGVLVPVRVEVETGDGWMFIM